MEIQTFFLAERINQVSGTSRHDVQFAAVARLECTPNTVFPVRYQLPGLFLLRREISTGTAPFSLLFNLVDEDGQNAGIPCRLLLRSEFPDGYKFFYLKTDITFEFPARGSYRLDITPDEGLTDAVLHYNIEVRETWER